MVGSLVPWVTSWADVTERVVQSYEVSFRGMRAGLSADTTTTMTHDSSSGEWVIETSGRARGLAAVLVRSVPTETTRFVVADGRIQPLRYVVEHGTERNDKDIDVTFDWNAGIARVTEGNQTAELPLEQGMLSPLTADLALRLALAGGAERVSFKVIEGLDVRQYSYEPIGAGGTRDTEIGAYETVKYRLSRSGSTRELIVWLAPELNYLPVYMEQWHKGKRKYRFAIQSFGALEGG